MKNKILLFLGLLISLFVVPYFVNFIVSTSSFLGFIAPGKQETWINFYGSILGGIMTLLGVWWTIEYTNSTRRDDQKKYEAEKRKEYQKRDIEIKRNLSVQYKPILNISFHPDFIIEQPFGLSTYKEYYRQNDISLVDITKIGGKRLAISLLVVNVGRGEARKLKIDSLIMSAEGKVWETVTRNYEEICMSNGISINFYKTLNENEWEKYADKILEQPVRMKIKINYEDLVGYQHSLKAFVIIKRFIHMKNEAGERIPDVIVMNPYDSSIQNETSSAEF